VGSGSIMVVLLMMLYPRLTTSELVGTDLVQAIPLVGAAAAGHLLFGDFRLGLTVSLLIGSLPGVYVGARLSARSNVPFIRPALAVLLLLSGAKLLNATNVELALIVLAAASTVLAIWWRPRLRDRSARSRSEVVAATPPRHGRLASLDSAEPANEA